MSLPFTPEDAQYYLQESNELREAYEKLRDVIREVLPKLEDVKKAIHACWLEAETADEMTFWGELEEDLENIINNLKNVLRETE